MYQNTIQILKICIELGYRRKANVKPNNIHYMHYKLIALKINWVIFSAKIL